MQRGDQVAGLLPRRHEDDMIDGEDHRHLQGRTEFDLAAVLHLAITGACARIQPNVQDAFRHRHRPTLPSMRSQQASWRAEQALTYSSAAS